MKTRGPGAEPDLDRTKGRRETSRAIVFSTMVAAALACSCTPKAQPVEQTEDAANRSPNATIVPAPLASATPTGETSSHAPKPLAVPADSRGRPLFADGGAPVPQPLQPGQALSADSLPGREAQGVTLAAEWVWTNVPAAPHTAETSMPGIEAARKLTRRLWTIDITEYGRMRAMFDSVAFTLPRYSELRARYDRYGHVLVWPSGDSYRVIPAGALRALLDERRVDVTPLMPERAKSGQSAGPRFGFPTTRMVLTTASGKLQIDQAHVVNVGLGGPLLCRLLVELVATEPGAATCAQNMIPVHAEYTWPEGGTLQFDVLTLNMRNDFPTGPLSVPPSGASFTASGLPPNASGIFLTRDQIAAFRTKAIDSPHPRTDPEARGAPGEGFVAVNSTDALRFVLIDGVPVGWVPPHEQQYVIGTARGRYLVQWRSLLGSFVGPAAIMEFPAMLRHGDIADAGVDSGAAARDN
jgi:hypothetical protein